MPTDHRPADAPPSDADRSSDAPRFVDRPPSTRFVDRPPSTRPDAGARSDLPDRIERTRLRTRVAALERSLLEEERRRQAIVDRYETILEAHRRDSNRPSAAADSRERERSDARGASGDGSRDASRDDGAGDGDSPRPSACRGCPFARVRRLLSALRP